MSLIDKDIIIKEIPIFADLTISERDIVKEKSEIREYKKGEIIYQEASPASAFYCVVMGRAVVYAFDKNGHEAVLEYLHHGKYFGIISLLTGEPHSVSAKAINDCLILVIEKDDFSLILKEIPRLAIDLSQTLSRRLKRKDIHQKTIFESTIISVYSSYSHAGKTIYALNLALSLKKETHNKSVIILDIAPSDKVHSLPQKLGQPQAQAQVFDLSAPRADHPGIIKDHLLRSDFGVDLICFHYKEEDDSCVKKLVGIISLLVNDYHYIVLDLPASMDRIIFEILNQSDMIHVLTSPESVDLKRTGNLIAGLQGTFNFNPEKIKVIINEYKFSEFTFNEQIGILKHPVFATLPRIEFSPTDRLVLDAQDCEYSKAVRRISRELGDSLVGLVLGVGVGYGFCHIGVLRVLEKEKIPIDVIAGSSIGALIASLWAIGKSSDEILAITKEFREPKHIWNLIDFTFPFLGFIKGNKLHKFLKKHLGDKTFHDVRLPLKVIASNVKLKEPKILDKGLLVDAIMASCAMPGVFAPFKFKEDMLFDGGVTNPLPTEALFKIGVKKIIAVNVTPSRDDIIKQYGKLKEKITVTLPADIKSRRWFSFGKDLKDSFRTNILDIIFSSIEILQSEVAEKEGQLADIVLHPDTSGLYWLELHRAEEFAKRGEEETRKNLDKIWQIINE